MLDACDRTGMLVMDENRHLGDVYTAKTHHGATANDLSDLATMIQRRSQPPERDHVVDVQRRKICRGSRKGPLFFHR